MIFLPLLHVIEIMLQFPIDFIRSHDGAFCIALLTRIMLSRIHFNQLTADLIKFYFCTTNLFFFTAIACRIVLLKINK